jgi:hypothetical protein
MGAIEGEVSWEETNVRSYISVATLGSPATAELNDPPQKETSY